MIIKDKIFTSFAVNDLQKAEDFYTEVLGLKLTKNKMGLLEIASGPGGRLIIYPKPDHTPASFTVLNFPVENIYEAVEALEKKGVKFEHYDGNIKTDEKGISRAEGRPSVAWFKDPSGNILSVIEE
ncbi:VOC family protein [Salegentibacter chungangensis]|uniref:VOC family protein n=1 Tax=Salegentibacter chungangensis TaxID=1335724 RepID=A0ABW3NSY2_9FLAO